MLNKTLALLLVFSLAFNVAFLAIWAHGRRSRPDEPATMPPQEVRQGWSSRPGGDGRRSRPPSDRLWEELEVTPEQKKQLDDSHARLTEKTETLRQEARTHREQLYKLMESELPDEAAVFAEQAAIDLIEQQQRRAVIEQMLEMRRILTPDQRQKWLEKMREFRERGRRRGRFGGQRPEAGPGAGPEPGGGPTERGPGRRGERPDPGGAVPMPERGLP